LITSRDNPRVRRWARLVEDSRFRRKERRAIVEGPHLVGLCNPVAVFASASAEARGLRRADAVVLSDKVFESIVEVESPQGVAAEIAIPEPGPLSAPAVFLEGIQDPGNVGTILRSAAAFGLRSAVLDRGCADPWSPKVLRAGMGAHFGLSIHAVTELREAMRAFPGRVLCAVPRGGVPLGRAELAGPLGWLFGAEGAGVSEALQELASGRISIPMAPGAESINVAAAAAICFHAACRPGAV
jgi:RNA methyltransferase, TrmH family